MIIRLYRLIFGYLRVRFYGDFKERILSLCAQNGITLWNNRLKSDGIECSILVKDFKFLRSVIRGKGVKVHILRKRGLPFVINRYRKRSGILVGVVLFFVFIQIMSGYIWIIDIKGNERVSDGQILSACEEIGIKTGIKKNSFYPKAKREELLLKLEGVAWGSLNIEGSRLTVNVTETKESGKNEGYSNLKAKSDGIIKKMDIVSGTSVVKVGQAVKKGDLLVSGIIENANGTRFVKSKGTVTAVSNKELIFKEDFSQKHLIPINKTKNKRVIELFGFKVPLYLGSEQGLFEWEKKETTLKLFSARLPIKIYEKKYSFLKEERVTYSYEDLCRRLENSLEETIEKDKDLNVLNKEFIRQEKGIVLKVITEKTENIASEENLIINAGN